MRPRLGLVFLLDAVLLISLCALEHVPFTGMILHEWLGLSLALMIVAHLLLSWGWLAAATKRFLFTASARARVNYVLIFCLFGVVTATIFSGVLISQQALPNFASTDARWNRVHDLVSNFVVVLAGLHLAINWDWLVTATKRLIFR